MPRAKRQYRPWNIMMPRIVREDGLRTFTWPRLQVKWIPGVGRGLFARDSALEAGTCIPVGGLVLTEHQFAVFQDQGIMPFVRYIGRLLTTKKHILHLDSDEEFYRGRGIVGAINEPQDQKKPNCIWKGNYVVVAQRIPAGEQLTISYGNELAYGRDYVVNRWVTRKLVYPELQRFPKSAPPRVVLGQEVEGTPEQWDDEEETDIDTSSSSSSSSSGSTTESDDMALR